jgi:hypothetical protein
MFPQSSANGNAATSDFSTVDYQVYLRQLATGKRERLSPSDLIDEAQAIVGMSAYRAAKRELGAKPTSEQREILAEFKDQLIKQYPGYGKIKPDYGKIERQIRGLEEAAFDPLLDDNPVAEGLRLYLEVRSGVLAQIDAAGGSNDLSTQGNTRYADGLFLIGEQIARQIPEFERVWNRVLVYELEVE